MFTFPGIKLGKYRRMASANSSPWDDDFSDNNFDLTKHTKIETANGTVTEQNGVLELRFNGNGSYNQAGIQSNAPLTGDFTVTVNHQNLSAAYHNGGLATASAYYFYGLSITIDGITYSVRVGEMSFLIGDIGNGTYYHDTSGGWVLYDSTLPSSGTLSASRSGSTFTVKRGSTVIKTWTGVSTIDPTNVSISFDGRQRAGDGTAIIDVTGVAYTL